MNDMITKKRISIILVLFLFNLLSLFAAPLQNGNIKGVVKDEHGEPLIGVAVVLKGTSQGTITDIDGNFQLAAKAKDVLQISYMGYLTQNITVGDQISIDVVMIEDIQQLEEVVVVGYGVQKKSHLTGSISKLAGEGLESIPTTRVDQALQGKLAGVSIQNTTSEAGVAPQIRVRGLGSLSVNGEPLVVVDGYPVADGLSFVEASDIESIEVLKDAASSAIYGSRGANGVIIVTTKTGNVSKPKYSFNMYHGFKKTYKRHDNMNYTDYVRLLFQEADFRSQDPSVASTAWNLATPEERAQYIIGDQIVGYDTDWQSEGLRDNAYMSNYQLNISGGNKGTRYYLSANYNTDQGVMERSSYDKLSLRSKIDVQLSPIVKVGVNINPTYGTRERPANNYTDYYRFRSWMPVRHTDGTAELTGQPVGSYAHSRHFNGLHYKGTMPDGEEWQSDGTINPWSSTVNNPVSILEGDSRKNNQYRLLTNAYASFNIIKGLEFKTSAGVYVNYSKDDAFLAAGAKKEGEPNQSTFKSSLMTDILSENTLNYDVTINRDHSIQALAGFTYQKTNHEYSQIVGLNSPVDDIKTANLATLIDSRSTYTYKMSEVLVSYLSRVNYAYKGKYMLSASIRTDGSSRFPSGKRWSWFPSVSGGWRMEEEAFMKEVDFISGLKLRASYGLTGNNNLPVNTNGSNRLSSYAFADAFFLAPYSFGKSGNIVAGIANSSYVQGNPEITWEQTKESNLGLNLGLFKNRITVDLEYYYSITKDLLFQRSVMGLTGYNKYWDNSGKVRNSGLEIELSTVNVINKDFEWRTSFNFSTNWNKLLSLGGPAVGYNYGERNEVYAAIVGQKAIQYYGYKTDGVWKSQEEIDEAKKNADYKVAVAPGGLKIVDTNGDDIVDAGDRVAIGSPLPDFTWGITNNLRYKSFELSFLVQGVQGVDIINGDHHYNDVLMTNKKMLKNRWISPAFPGDGQTPYYTNGASRILTDYVVEDGSYIAFRDIQIGYTLPAKFVKKHIGLNSARVYAGAQNLLYIMASGYKGINPESRYTSGSPYDSPLVDGYQRGGFPLQRTFTFGLNVTF